MKFEKVKQIIEESKITSVKTDSHGKVVSRSYEDETDKPKKSNGLKPGTDKEGISKSRELARRAIALMVKEEQDIELTEEQLDEMLEEGIMKSIKRGLK